MRKHIFGFALFSSIIFTFALVFAFFNAPAIPKKEEVKQPVLPKETVRENRDYYCPKKSKDLTYRVMNSEFDSDSGKFTSNISLSWNGYGKPPKKIFVKTQLFTMDTGEKAVLDFGKPFIEPFGESRSTIITVETKISSAKIDPQKNLYAGFDFSEDEFSSNFTVGNAYLTEANQVLMIGKKPSNNTTRLGRGNIYLNK